MPAEARGSAYKLQSGKCGVRWYEDGSRKFKSGFTSKSQALAYFRDVVRPRLLGQPEQAPELTFGELCDKYLAAHAAAVSPSTIATLEARLVRPRKEFGDVLCRDLERRVVEIAGWQAKLPERFRYAVMSSFRQVCAAGVRWGVMSSNPAVAVGSNPQPQIVERDVLEPAQVDTLAAEMNTPYGAAVIVGAWCYLRPSELLGLERRDVGDGVLNVNGSKTRRSVRTVPLPLKAAEALSALPARI